MFLEIASWLSALLFLLSGSPEPPRPQTSVVHRVRIGGVYTTVDQRFSSFAIGSSAIKKGKSYFGSNQLRGILSLLSPCYLRVGGTQSDFLLFENCSEPPAPPATTKHFNNFTMSESTWSDINEMASSAGCRLIFDLNVLLRRGDRWQPENAARLLRSAVSRRHRDNIHFQLGNEPNSLLHVTGRSLPAEVLARDFRSLRRLLDRNGFSGSLLIGPEVTRPKKLSSGSNTDSLLYLKKFLSSKDLGWLSAISWHQYYVDGRTSSVHEFTSPETMRLLEREIAAVQTVTAGRRKRLWLTETGSAWGGGARGLSDCFVASFLYVDKLGLAASRNVSLVVRQSLIGASYGLVSEDYHPLPDFWVALLYRKLVSNRVLRLDVRLKSESLRVYAHCARDSSRIVVFGSNLASSPARIELSRNPTKLELYQLSANNLTDKSVYCNGRILRYSGSPVHIPGRVQLSTHIRIGAKRIFFVVFRDAETSVCQ